MEFTPIRKVDEFIPMKKVIDAPYQEGGADFIGSVTPEKTIAPLDEQGKVVLQRQVADMIKQGKGQEEIDSYLRKSGVSKEELLADKYTIGRTGAQTLGGMAAGRLSPTPTGIALGGAMAGQAYDLAAEALGKKVPETLGERISTAAQDFSLDVISTPALSQGIYAAKKMANYGAEAFRELMPKPKTDLVKFREFGVTPTVAEMTGSRSATIMENALSDFPFTSSYFQKHAKKSLDELKFANRLIAEDFGGAGQGLLTKQEEGMLIREGSEKAIGKLKEIYGKVFDWVGQGVGTQPLQISNTATFLNDMTGRVGKEPVNQNVLKIAQDVMNAGALQGWNQPTGNAMRGIQWEDLKKWRSEVGELLKNPLMLSQRDMNTGQLKQLYSAMTQDMEDAALKAGPDVHARWRAADKYFQVSMTRDVPLLERIVSKGYDEEIRAAVTQSQKDGGSRLKVLKRRLSPEEFDAVVATELGTMGKAVPNAQDATGDVFSINTFMTKYMGLSPEAKKVMFGGTQHAELAKQLDRFAEVSSALKDVDRLANKSKTGSVLGFLSIFSAMGATTGGVMSEDTGAGIAKGAAMGSSLILAPRMLSRMMTSPKFVEWLSDGIKVAKSNPNNMSTHLARLMYLRFEPEIQEGVNDIIVSQLKKQ